MREIRPIQRMRGATLVVALIMLILIAIIGFGAMQTTTMEEKMSGNLRDKNISFQAAEAGLREREAWLRGLSTAPPIAGWLTKSGDLDLTLSFPFGAVAMEYGDEGVQDMQNVSSDPVMVMEEMEFLPDDLVTGFDVRKGRDFYRVISEGRGQTVNSTTVLETTYAKRFN
ncbi:pilus assembly PilX family protein [Pseudidiomarina sp.]|uniref:pilus assembly PilX family protein n=1 Tax=Pseudidiomarina sp. TaxID=2081707 RepID=UPI003A982556